MRCRNTNINNKYYEVMKSLYISIPNFRIRFHNRHNVYHVKNIKKLTDI